MGVRSATPPEAAPAALERLLAKHRYGDGCGIARAGMPTNNTDTAKAGWQPPSGDMEQLFAIDDAPRILRHKRACLASRRLASRRASRAVERIRAAMAQCTSDRHCGGNRDEPRSGARTLDDFVGEFLKTVVSPETAAAVHAFFVRWVSGRGHYRCCASDASHTAS